MTTQTSTQTGTSKFATAKEEYTGTGGGRGGDELTVALKDLPERHSLTVHAAYAGDDYHWIQVKASALGKTMGRRYRTQKQTNGDVKVFRVAIDG